MYKRRILREIYGLYASTQSYRIKSVFLVGRTKDDILQANIEREHHQYRDMLQGQFYDHYHNLTYKTIMGYRWTRLYCKNIKLILKIDDDVFLDVYKFFDFFLPLVPKHKRTVYGFLNYHPRVFRDGKYRVGVEEYAGKNYPNFCSGFFVVPTLDLIDEIYEVSKTVRFFRLEDVFTYGLVRENMVDVQLVHLDVITYDLKSYKDCVNDYRYRCKYMAVEVPPSQLLTTYNQVVKFRKQLGLTSGGAN
ncbi:beta-1,3-galactosyltransferase 5-like isoform X2 [Physella acuta]|uniref:beta-1,3-galactosyltransferase 5-like isoform X2 n=2 Tax=Physella acuta TaxID=109671 RepID=UPI0027DD756A|nr:beta-1,3-galactosyltransferase 5-like isoform X2 [Physella acuta]